MGRFSYSAAKEFIKDVPKGKRFWLILEREEETRFAPHIIVFTHGEMLLYTDSKNQEFGFQKYISKKLMN